MNRLACVLLTLLLASSANAQTQAERVDALCAEFSGDVPGVAVAVIRDSEVVLARREWQLLPGQLVGVDLDVEPAAPGLYVPMKSFRSAAGDQGELFVVQGDAARRVAVQILDRRGELFRVAAAEDAGADLIQPGALVISDPVHFLMDGEPVRVIQRREVAP